jgi:hypothetical protein
MGIVHRATLSLSKQELVELWLPMRPRGSGLRVAGKLGEYRFDDPAGDSYRLIGAIRRSHVCTVVIPDPSHLRYSGCLTNADIHTAARHLRARILIAASESRQPPRTGVAQPR